jgi:hypothetical protein
MKFKVFLIRFIFDFKIIFTLNFLKTVLRRVSFSPGFLPEAGFPGEHVFRGFSGAPAVIRTTLHFTFEDTPWGRISWRAFFRGF